MNQAASADVSIGLPCTALHKIKNLKHKTSNYSNSQQPQQMFPLDMRVLYKIKHLQKEASKLQQIQTASSALTISNSRLGAELSQTSQFEQHLVWFKLLLSQVFGDGHMP